MSINAPGYPPSYYAELLDLDAGAISQLGVLSSADISGLSLAFPIDLSKGTVLVKMSGTLCFGEFEGWTVSVELPDGGPYPDGGYQLLYLGANDVPDSAATSMSRNGGCLIDGLDSSISDFVVITASNPDAGDCPVITSSVGFTGRVFVSDGALSLFPVLLP